MKRVRQLGVVAAIALSGIAIQGTAADSAATQSTSQDQTAMQGMAPVDAAAFTTTFTVEKVDPQTRTVTLKAPDGSTEQFKCGPEIRNFDQIRQGDQVKATVIDQLAVGIRPSGEPSTGSEQTVAIAPKGAKPGVVSIRTDEITAKILAIDSLKRIVALEGPSGMDMTMKVSPKVDLKQIKKGDTVTVQVARGAAITVESPEKESAAQPAGTRLGPQETPKQPDSQQQSQKNEPDH